MYVSRWEGPASNKEPRSRTSAYRITNRRADSLLILVVFWVRPELARSKPCRMQSGRARCAEVRAFARQFYGLPPRFGKPRLRSASAPAHAAKRQEQVSRREVDQLSVGTSYADDCHDSRAPHLRSSVHLITCSGAKDGAHMHFPQCESACLRKRRFLLPPWLGRSLALPVGA